MRILQIIPSISLVYGGPSQMVLGLSAALATQGIDVTIITTDSNGDIGQPALDVPLNQPIQQDGYRIIYFRCSPFRRYKFSLSLLQWLNNHIEEFDLAHIHAIFSPVSTAAATIARYRNLPYIMRPCGMLDPADLCKKKRLKLIYAALLERPNLAGAAAIHFTSKQEAKISERFGISTGKMSKPQDLIIPLGVQVTPDTIFLNSTVPQILFMSRIEPKKGLNLLLPALENIIAAGIKFNFVLAGSNPQDVEYERNIRLQIEASPLAKCTTIAGFVTGDRKAALLQNADLFVLPSYYENFGIAVAEAMAYGKPVVISDQVHIWEDIKQAEAGWVGPLEVEAIASLIKIALLDADERKRRGLNAKEYAKKYYSWDAIAQQTIQAYQQITLNFAQ
ncbi:MAG TPA: hormogonium polysaccharide biosynthesis glycosyltransferase HpsP [Kamptonema sp.]|nr:hormogonium polysaccharide biosynthesis glycosyltransferase HpsP [Kamptonema sp.]